MKTFRLRCKKLCAVVLMIVTAFGFSFATPKTAQAANTKYWIKVNKQARHPRGVHVHPRRAVRADLQRSQRR